MHRDREEEMSVPMYGQTFTLAQMQDAIDLAYASGWRSGDGSFKELDLEDHAEFICEAANLPMIDVLAGLQRLADWRDWHHDHPV